MPLAPYAVFMLGIVVSAVSVASPLYTVTQVGPTGGGYAGGLNDLGQVVGRFGGPDLSLYSNGTYTDLGFAASAGLGAEHINNAGQISGTILTPEYSAFGTAFLSSAGAVSDIVIPGQSSSYATGINNSGQVIGDANEINNGNPVVGFLYSGGAATVLLPPGAGASAAQAINGSGEVIGSYANFTDGNGSFLYQNGSFTLLPANVGLNGINDSGETTGVMVTSPFEGYAFIYSNGVYSDLGTVPGFQSSTGDYINASGEVAGTLNNGNDPIKHAFIYANGSMMDLNSVVDLPGETLAYVEGLNNAGQILVEGYPGDTYTGPFTNYLLTPIATTATPEPSTFALFGGGIAVFVVFSRRRTARRGIRHCR